MEEKKRIPFAELTQYQAKLQACVAELEGTTGVNKKIAANCQEGSLIGGAGEEFVRVLLEQFNPAIMRLEDKTIEVISELQQEVKEAFGNVESEASRYIGRN